MGREELQLKEAKRAYEIAKAEGNRQEEARWANVIGNALKHRGEYVKALKWFRVDYEVTKKYLPEKHLLPTCQSLGEVYLRLEDFENALTYQKKHLELAKDANDIVEQQRASTQLGRTYQEMFTRSENDHSSHHNARKYFKSALKLAENLKKNPPTYKSSFLKEYIDAVNNVGMLQKELDNLEEAEKLLTRGLDICDEEEVSEDDEGRSRLHHNLGNVYIESRMWRKALEHINKDIIICNRIGHCLGEAKGYINLGEVNYKKQKYEEAIQCYHKALALAKSMQDEDALVCQINENIKTANAAKKVMDELKKEEQNLKKLTRDVKAAKGTSRERKCLLKQDASLDCLIEKSSIISEWQKHLEFAKKKKKIASELCDKGKLSNALLLIGESYQNLRNFDKAIKWHEKCWNVYKSLGDLEGQASAKINIGNALDCKGDWTNALDAYQEGYRIAVEANVPSSQLLALENMHYCHMIRFDNIEEARRLKAEIDKLKKSKSNDIKMQDVTRDCCSETDTEGSNQMSDSMPNAYCSPEFSKSVSGKQNICAKPTEASQKSLSSSTNSQQALVGRKRVRVVLSDDEDEMQDDVDGLDGRLHKSPYKVKSRSGSASSASNFQDIQAEPSKHDRSCCNPINIEESTCSHKCLSPKPATRYGNAIRSSSSDKAHNESDFDVSCSKDDVDVSGNIVQRNNPSSSKLCTSNANNDDLDMIKFRIDGDLIVLEAGSCIAGDKLNTESLKVELACLYYLQLPGEKRSKGLLPIIKSMKCAGSRLESLEAFKTCKNQLGMDAVEISVDGWVQKRLMKLYVDSCMEFSEKPNMKLLKKLYISEVEDEVIASECELQDISITPLLNALQTQKRVAMLDFSHNLLGNGTMEKLQQFFNSSGQKYGDLTLDLHCNRFGPTALFQICECPVLFTRLEVLNLCGNRLTDACGSYLSAILENCKALYSLNIENCSITTRTIQKVADALSGESLLAQLCIGHNQPIAGNAIIKLLEKLGNFESFSELSLKGLRLSKPVINSLCHLSKTSCLSHLMLGGTGIGTDDALCLIESLSGAARDSVKLDLSYCGLSSMCIHKFNADVSVIGGILELNLGGNPIQQEGGSILASLLKNPQCYLKVLVLNKCQLGLAGTLHLIQALAENDSLEELNLADNANLDKQLALQCNSTDTVSGYLLPNGNTSKEVGIDKLAICPTNTDCNQLEVADSEDEEIKVETTTSGLGDSCANSCQKNSSMECQFVQEFSAAICMAKHLQLLDLSNNSFSTHVAEELYLAWSSREGACSTWKHIEKRTLHFSMEENKCCRLKPCCRRN